MKNIVIAKITSAQGIKGLVRVISFTANPADFVKYSGKIFDAKNRQYKLKIINQIPGGNGDLFAVQVEGITNRNEAELFRNTELFIKRSDLKKSKKDEFYHTDLIGLDVLNKDEEKIGKVIAINDFGAGGLVEIDFDDKNNPQNQITNFIFSDKIFPEINIEEGYLRIEIPDIVEVKENSKTKK
ncbi:MAG: rimM [Rickettsiaceae bacterium]|jgi:16S rRNA processing protein RimM|nr:rimM [Rickettsiaceae bacterium]